MGNGERWGNGCVRKTARIAPLMRSSRLHGTWARVRADKRTNRALRGITGQSGKIDFRPKLAFIFLWNPPNMPSPIAA